MSNKVSDTITLTDLLAFCNAPSDLLEFGSELSFQMEENNYAIWFSPMAENYSATFKLQAIALPGDWTDTTAVLHKVLKDVGFDSIVPSSITMIVKQRMMKHASYNGLQCEKAPEVGLTLAYPDFSAIMFCSLERFTFALRWPNGALVAAKDILKTVGRSELVSSFEDVLSQISKVTNVLQVSVQIERAESISAWSKATLK